MDPIFASVILGFFALVIALVAIAVAIAYRQSEIADKAIENLISEPSKINFPEPENPQPHSRES
ncbi:MAG: hypothetical protein HYR94_14010 [Chloroflexi bacterium]|nr:hypothetical protein [Chloroflexota bacterium]